jgi:hypothetical protein
MIELRRSAGRSAGIDTIRILPIAIVLILGSVLPKPAWAQMSSPLDLVKRAVEAQGGVGALRALKRIAIKGEVRHWEPEESYVAGGPPVFTDRSTFSIVWDLENGMARTDWDRAIQFPATTHDIYSETVTPTRGYADVAGTELTIKQADLPPPGKQAMSGIRVAAHLRELERSSPILPLKAMDSPQKLTALPDQILGGGLFYGAFGGYFPAVSLPAVAFADGATNFTILFDRKTHLPTAVRTRDDDAILGDSNYDAILSDWRSVAKTAYTSIVANPFIPAGMFVVRVDGDFAHAIADAHLAGRAPHRHALTDQPPQH